MSEAWAIETLLEAGPGLGGGQRLGFELVAPQPGVERFGTGEQRFERLAAAGADHVVGVLAGSAARRSAGPVGARAAAKRASPLGSRPSCRHCRHRSTGSAMDRAATAARAALRSAPFRWERPPRDPGAVEGDHVHIAFDHDQPLRGAARRSGAVEIVERPALVEERVSGGS